MKLIIYFKPFNIGYLKALTDLEVYIANLVEKVSYKRAKVASIAANRVLKLIRRFLKRVFNIL